MGGLIPLRRVRYAGTYLDNIREALDLCLEDMESCGEEIPDPNNVLIGSVVSR